MVDGIKWIELLIKGIVVGYIASIPLGPIGVICIQRTLSKGKLSGFVSGLGASTADTFLSIVAGLGLSFIIDFVVDYTAIFKLLGGILVIFLGFRIFFKNPVHQFRRKKLKKNNLYTDYISTLVLTLSNPLNIFLFLLIQTLFQNHRLPRVNQNILHLLSDIALFVESLDTITSGLEEVTQ